ncbi:glycine zipper 2TM domain-containing protein [Halomonas sp. BM-2019]|uniref:glycine zipper 2TM domain-containing protein n=1 Tax=Halomonas sp. BM-2019 TaxID=2811227 RepID=UPI0031FD32D9
MSKSIIVGSTLAVLGLGGLAFGAWQVQQQGPEQGPAYAEIVGVEALTRSVETPREVCEEVVVQAAPQAPAQGQAGSRDPHRVVGTAAGAIVGGLLGNQVGGGSGKKLATVAGAGCRTASRPTSTPRRPSPRPRRPRPPLARSATP